MTHVAWKLERLLILPPHERRQPSDGAKVLVHVFLRLPKARLRALQIVGVRKVLNLNRRFSTPQVKYGTSEVEAGSCCNEDADVRSWLLPVEKGWHGRLFQERRAAVQGVRGEDCARRSAFGVALREYLLRVRVRAQLTLSDQLDPAESQKWTETRATALYR